MALYSLGTGVTFIALFTLKSKLFIVLDLYIL